MRPSKSYFYKILYQDISNELKKNKNLNFIDFACGHAQILKDFKFQNYTGIDIDEKEISSLKLKYPQQKFYSDDILFFKSSIKSDLACCVETFGFNTKFNTNKLLDSLKNISNCLNENGSLFFNIQNKLFEENIENLNFFFKNFEKVKIRRYGFFSDRYSKFNHKILFLLEKIISKNINRGKYLYIKCENYSQNLPIK
mgnify:CR=1 FL=1